MARQLFRLAATNQSMNETSYFYKRSTAITVSVNYSIAKAIWIKGNGSAVGTGALALATNGYYNLFINGVLQQSSMYSVNSVGVVLTALTAAYTISASSPFTLTVANSAPTLVAVP